MRPSIALQTLFSVAFMAGASFADSVSGQADVEASPGAPSSWTQWGGPTRDFVIEGSPPLASSWPADGPPRLWQRALGGGYSQILAADGVLFVTFRRDEDDVVAALDAATGETRWEQRYTTGPYPEQTVEFGTGPNATPLLTGGRLITVGFTSRVHALDPETGEIIWFHNLAKDFGGKQQRFGYSAAPVAYRDMAILLVGGDRHGAVGFDLETGEVRWKSPPLDISYASPSIIELGGEDQLIFMTSKGIVGVSLADAAVKWSHPHKNQYGNNCAGPWWGPDGLMFVSSQADGGGRTLLLEAEAGRVSIKEVSRRRDIKIFHNSAVRIRDHLYGASGSFFVAHNVKTGEDAWKQRGFPEANVVVADGKAILLDEGGTLTLATLTPEKLTVLSQAPLLNRPAWTAPTLVGTRLYLRDKEKIMALELGAP